eukprot:TRINITY_DN16178_c0_g1_i1.p1 TRINITY_DN16178_c0_g1~~TRINITY_DN16178_c0_g1_i1.p1  ORF type:complete len:297 (-),score=70.74 TRINITY_DN16178_c0_g1_i1:78-968(-)
MSALPTGHCCGVPGAAAGGPPPFAMWDKMKDWYINNMSPSSAHLANSLFSRLGLHGDLAADGEKKLKVLETHCGDARAAAVLLPSGRVASYTACDFSPEMLAVAKGRLEGKAETVLCESTALPFEAESFDRYMSNLGCCCVSDFDAKLSEARRVLVPGGVIAMSIRTADVPGDTAFHLADVTLKPFGIPPGPDREGLHIGKDLPRLRAKMQQFGFKDVKAWRSWITIPLEIEGGETDGAESYVKWATSQGPIAKFIATLEEDKRAEAVAALEAAAAEPVQQGAVQVAAAVVVATAA